MAQARPNSRSPLGMPFPYQLALAAVVYKDLVKALKECKRLSDRTGATYFLQLPMYTAALPYHWVLYPEDMTRFLQREITEPAIKRQFEKEGLINWCKSLPTLYPLVTTGDGNCLLHAAALYMWGIEDSELFLRTSLWESMVNGSFSDNNKQRWQAERSSVDQAAMSFEFRYNTKEWNEEYDMLKTMAAPIVDDSGYDLPYKSLEEFHIYALANMLRRPIMIISNDKIRNPEGASLQPQSVSGLYLPLDWDPSLCCKFPIVLGFSHSHFFPLVHTAPEDEKDEVDLMVPLRIHNELAKVHFTLPGEDPPALITDYLHVDNFIHCPKNSEIAFGVNGAKLSCANMGRNYSVWVPYFDLAETNLRIYNEGLYVGPDKSDSSPTYQIPQEEFPPLKVKRSKCQRPGGCPDGMFGDPAKKNLCSKCWKAVGEVMPATQRAPGAHQGKYKSLYVGPDKSDSSPTYRIPQEEFPPLKVKRSKCQRPGGCPDGMFGDPAKKNLCSNCWKAVGEVMPVTQRAPGAHQGKYDTMYAGRA